MIRKLLRTGVLLSTVVMIAGAIADDQKDAAKMAELKKKLAHPLIVQGAVKGDLDAVRDRLASGEMMESANPRIGWTALIAAAYHGHANIVTHLLSEGASVSAVDVNRKQALHHAAGMGRLKIAQSLFDAGARIEAQDVAGFTPLMYAAKQGHTGIVKLLVNAGVNINQADRRGMTALHWAALKGEKESVALLITLGANVNAASRLGGTAYAYAHTAGFQDLLPLLKPTDAKANTGFDPIDQISDGTRTLKGGRS